MRTTIAILALAAAVLAGPQERYLELGRKRMAKLAKAKTNATKLSHIRAARYYFKRAKKAGAADLVKALNSETAIYYWRKSLSLATKRNEEALKISPKDKTALRWRAAIEKAREKDIYEDAGTTAIQRVRARRARNGVPLRNRGRARRR
ncbi:MAG: hypothetical protein OER88_02320 [Planctomycetota bacterium]|nr:hypothetical protein [Planctomycetota bacterium]